MHAGSAGVNPARSRTIAKHRWVALGMMALVTGSSTRKENLRGDKAWHSHEKTFRQAIHCQVHKSSAPPVTRIGFTTLKISDLCAATSIVCMVLPTHPGNGDGECNK
eukprot:3426555-Amphidinium_carterae.2